MPSHIIINMPALMNYTRKIQSLSLHEFEEALVLPLELLLHGKGGAVQGVDYTVNGFEWERIR